MPNTMPDMVSRPAVVKKSFLGCEWSREVQKLKTTKFQNPPVPKPAGAARGLQKILADTLAIRSLFLNLMKNMGPLSDKKQGHAALHTPRKPLINIKSLHISDCKISLRV